MQDDFENFWILNRKKNITQPFYICANCKNKSDIQWQYCPYCGIRKTIRELIDEGERPNGDA